MTSTATNPAIALIAFFALLGGARLAVGADRENVVLDSPGNPLVNFRFVFHVGSAQDPPGKEGLAGLTALMLSQGGTEEMSLTQVMEALYPMAASVGAQSDKEVTTFIGRAHRDHIAEFYSVFRERLQRPRFDPADFDRNKKEVLNYLTKFLRSADDEELSKQSLEWTLFSSHPYRHPVQGTVGGVEAITLDDVKSFYLEHYTFENLQIGLAGNLPEGFADRVREDFRKSLPSEGRTRKRLPPVSTGPGLTVVIVEKPSADSTAISIGFPIDVTRADDDFYPLLVANVYLGDHRSFHGVLMNELRAKRGLNYGDYSYIEHFIQDGGSTFPVPNIPRRQQYFSIWVRPVAPENGHFALRGAIYYLRRLVDKGMSAEDFEGTREYLLSYSKLWAQSLDRRLGYQLDSSYYQTDYFLDEIEERLATMTVEDVDRAVKKHLDRWGMRVAIVAANAEELSRAIENNVKSPVTYQSEGTPDAVLEEDRSIEILELPIESVKVVPVDEMFQN